MPSSPAGASVYFTTDITEGVSYRTGNHWRASAAPVSRACLQPCSATSLLPARRRGSALPARPNAYLLPAAVPGSSGPIAAVPHITPPSCPIRSRRRGRDRHLPRRQGVAPRPARRRQVWPPGVQHKRARRRVQHRGRQAGPGQVAPGAAGQPRLSVSAQRLWPHGAQRRLCPAPGQRGLLPLHLRWWVPSGREGGDTPLGSFQHWLRTLQAGAHCGRPSLSSPASYPQPSCPPVCPTYHIPPPPHAGAVTPLPPPPPPTPVVPTLKLISAQAFGPASAQASATGAAGVTWVEWRFTATPATGAAIKRVQKSDAPLAWWYNLAADTSCECLSRAEGWATRGGVGMSVAASHSLHAAWHFGCPPAASHPAPSSRHVCCADTISVVGITSSKKEVRGANTLTIRTPQAGAPVIAAAIPTGPTTALIRLNPPTDKQAANLYTISVCLKDAPKSCVTKDCTSIECAVSGLKAGSENVVRATAVIGIKQQRTSNSLPLRMPAADAPTLLTAEATGAFSGAATAAPPKGATFTRVRAFRFESSRGCWGVGAGMPSSSAAPANPAHLSGTPRPLLLSPCSMSSRHGRSTAGKNRHPLHPTHATAVSRTCRLPPSEGAGLGGHDMCRPPVGWQRGPMPAWLRVGR